MIKRPRQHNDKHLDFIRSLPCVICGEKTHTEEAAHIRFDYPLAGKRQTGMGEKPDDKWTVPLCGQHHREQHHEWELGFWSGHGWADWAVILTAQALFINTGNHEVGEQIVRAAHA